MSKSTADRTTACMKQLSCRQHSRWPQVGWRTLLAISFTWCTVVPPQVVHGHVCQQPCVKFEQATAKASAIYYSMGAAPDDSLSVEDGGQGQPPCWNYK